MKLSSSPRGTSAPAHIVQDDDQLAGVSDPHTCLPYDRGFKFRMTMIGSVTSLAVCTRNR